MQIRVKKFMNIKYLILLILLAVFLRLYPIFPDYFSFMFDNAKDSLVLMDMGMDQDIPLIGTVTSIDGVFNGPFWYYLLLPLNMLMKYHPLASVISVITLSCISIFLLWKYVGKTEAVIFTTSIGVIGSQQTAWSPYATPFPMVLILILLLNLSKTSKHTVLKVFLLAIFTSTLFHFQTAFGIVITPIIFLLMIFTIKRSTKKNFIKYIIVYILAFVIPFFPFIVFELRHNFQQTNQILLFLKDFRNQSQIVSGSQESIFMRTVEMLTHIISTGVSTVSPIFITNIYIQILVVSAVFFAFIAAKKQRILLILVILTSLLYLFLPFKQYYLVGLLPVFTLMISTALRSFPKVVRYSFLGGLVLLSLYQAVSARQGYLQLSQTQSFPLHPKMRAVGRVYTLSEGKEFSSYHFVPEIYDYTYQFIYLYSAQFNNTLPREFSYAPEEYSYMKAMQHMSEGKTDQIFLIEETPINNEYYQQWKNRIPQYDTFTQIIPINENINVAAKQ